MGKRTLDLGDMGILMFLPFLIKLPLKTKSSFELFFMIIDAALLMLKIGLGIVVLCEES